MVAVQRLFLSYKLHSTELQNTKTLFKTLDFSRHFCNLRWTINKFYLDFTTHLLWKITFLIIHRQKKAHIFIFYNISIHCLDPCGSADYDRRRSRHYGYTYAQALETLIFSMLHGTPRAKIISSGPLAAALKKNSNLKNLFDLT